jgi:hypothetical protein
LPPPGGHADGAACGKGHDKEPADKGGACPQPKKYQVWASGEYLLWWVSRGPVTQPLVTTGPPGSSGILGQPGVAVVAGPPGPDYSNLDGARVTLGAWLDEFQHTGVELAWFDFAQKTDVQTVASDGNGAPLLSRPVVNAMTGAEAVSPVALPTILVGRADVRSSLDLWGAEANLVGSLVRGRYVWVDMTAGFRYLQLNEDFSVGTTSTLIAPGPLAFVGKLQPPGTTVGVEDVFRTQNQFYGGQLGLRGEVTYGRFFFDLAGKLAVGNNEEFLVISGGTAAQGPAGVAAAPGGLLAVASNSRLYSHGQVTVIPELTAKVGFCLTPHLGAFFGYNLLYWPYLARPENQIDRTVAPQLVPTNLAFGQAGAPARPTTTFPTSHFWAQGLVVGVEYRY